jgi:hypothetical protein
MYGLIHAAIQQLVVDRFGQEAWQQVMTQSKTPADAFMSTRSYDDSVTYGLVGAVAELAEVSTEECLELFGQFWLAEFAPQSYDMLLSAAGSTLFEFLDNLNALHDRISTTFVGYGPPSFRVEKLTEAEAIVHYRSGRSGLVPFVLGLIKGMQDRFDVEIQVLDVKTESSGTGDQAAIHIMVTPR